MIKLKEKSLRKLKKGKLTKRLAALGTAGVLMFSATACSKEEKKDKVLTSETGMLYLVPILDEEVVLKDIEGNELKYEFNENTVAIVGSEDGVTKKGKEYEVMLVDDIGNITYGYVDGKYLSDTYLDSVNVENSEFMTYYVSQEDGATLEHNIETQDNRKISTLLDPNVQVIGSVSSVDNDLNEEISEALLVFNKKFIYGFINKKDLSHSEIIVDGIDSSDEPEVIYNDSNEIYIVNTEEPLNVRIEANTASDRIDRLPYGTEVTVMGDVEPKSDNEIKWVYIKFESTETKEVSYGWVAAEIFAKNDYYIVKKSEFVDKRKKPKKDKSINFSEADADIDDLSAKTAVVYNASTGQILFSKDMLSEREPASITKMLSAYVVYKYGNLDDYVTYSARAASADGHIGEGYGLLFPYLENVVKEGTKISVKDALHMSLMLSDNCTTIALEEYIESVTGRNFVELMNEEAKNMECTSSNFTNCFGYQDKKHVTSALDMAKITRYLINNAEEIIEIMGTQEYVLESYLEDGKEVSIKQQVKLLLETEGSYNKYAIAAKSGFHDGARWTLVVVYEKDDNKYVVVTMGDPNILDAMDDAEYLADCFDFGANDISLEDKKVLGLH